MLKARFFFFVSLNEPLRLQLKNCLRIWIASVVEVPVLFSSGRKVLDCSLPLDEFGTSCCFIQGLYCSLPLDEFGTSCCFPQGGTSSICIFVAARPVWNVVPFSSGRKDLVCLLSLNWTSCLTSCHSTNLERRAVFSRENILLFVLLSSLDEFGTSCWLLTLFVSDRLT